MRKLELKEALDKMTDKILAYKPEKRQKKKKSQGAKRAESKKD